MQGAIGDLLTSKNEFSLNSQDVEQLKSCLKTHPRLSKVENKEGKLFATFNDTIKGSELNQFLFEKGIVVSELVEVKSSLEDEFLEIVKNK